VSNIDDQQIRQFLHTEEPVTVRLYGFKDVTFPSFVIMLVSGIVFATLLLVCANELIAPQTAFGQRVQRQVEPWILTVALWTPPVLLLAIATEVVEGAIVFRAFRKKFAARWAEATRKLQRTLVETNDEL
jgi:hypothetical protein